MTHANAYGLQVGSCPGGKAVYVAGEPEKDCGVDPFTGSGTSFDRESGANAYSITVRNGSGSEFVGGVPVGTRLTCDGGPASATSIAYQWLRNGAPIGGATIGAYTTVAADAGKEVQCQVTARNAEGSTNALSTALLVESSSASLSAANPTISGSASVGQSLTCNPGSWSGNPTPSFTYQWLANGVSLGSANGAQTATYTVQPADLGKALQCQVSGTSSTLTILADTTGATVLPEAPANTAIPTVTDTTQTATPPVAGDVLSCSSGSWSGGASFTYQWLANGVSLGSAYGAQASSYTVQAADAGKALQCQVIDTGSEGVATGAVSANTVTQTPPIPPPPIAPAEISLQTHPGGQLAVVGTTLSCFHLTWANGTGISYDYRFLRNGVPIPGAESGPTTAQPFEYTLSAADRNAKVQCEVIGTTPTGGSVAISKEIAGPTGTHAVAPAIPAATASVPSTATVSVSDKLPAGLTLAAGSPGAEASGTGWSCPIANPSTVTCVRSDSLGPGASYPLITLHVHVGSSAPLGTPPSGGVTNLVTVYGGGASSASASDPTAIAEVPFGIASFTTSVTGSLAEPFTQAAGHPFAANATFTFNYLPSEEAKNGEVGLRTAGGSPRDIETELPPGFVGNPQASPKCADATFAQRGQTPCPSDTAVGYVLFSYSQGQIVAGKPQPFAGYAKDPVYNLAPGAGQAATFGFKGGVSEAAITLGARVRSDGDYGITISSSRTATPTVLGINLTFCENGVTQEGEVTGFGYQVSCTPVSSEATPFLTNPSQCSGAAPLTTLSADSYEEPAAYAAMRSYAGAPSGPPAFAGQAATSASPQPATSFATGCDLLRFVPEVAFAPSPAAEGGTTQADEPTGATFALKVPQPERPEVNATPELKDATVTLPAGMTVDPSAADGLQACTNAQFGLGSTTEPAQPAECPLASQIGTVEVVTPLLEKPLTGQVFIGQPECGAGGVCTNADAEDGRLFRLFLQVRQPERGVVVKLAGKVHANPKTGQLQATFENQPQLPFSELALKLNGGVRAPLANPQSCGTFTTTTDLTPWSAPGLGGLSGSEQIPGTPDATPSSSFAIGSGCGGGFAPSFLAGTQGTKSTTAGAFSPFALTISRNDGEQDLSGISVTMPPGLLGKIAGIPRCPETQASAGTCGPESQIGTTNTGAGPGPHPFYLPGKVYLTGPYKGAAFGLSIVVPAVAGPFNLGDVVVRAAIAVDPHTAQITVASDPLPQYVDGVQLRLRKIHVAIDRPGFMFNPTSCAQQHVTGSIAAANGASEAVSSPFEVGGCQSLAFKPSFSASIHAKHTRKDGEYLHVVIGSGAGQANIAKVHVTLPGRLPSRDSTLKLACLAAQFEKDPAGCPPGSFVGTATAYTPVLAKPLSGPAVFVSHGGAAFPDLDVVLQGEGVTVILTGNTDIRKGITTSTFAGVPDVPVSRFDLVLPAGEHSALAGEGNLCYRTIVKRRRVAVRRHGHLVRGHGRVLHRTIKLRQKVRRHGHLVRGHGRVLHRTIKLRQKVRRHMFMPTTITGQNGAQITQKTKIAVEGCAGKGKAHTAGHHHHAKGKHKHSGAHHHHAKGKHKHSGAHRSHHANKRSGR